MTMNEDNDRNGRFRLTYAAAAQLAAWLVAGLLMYSAVHARVAVVEAQQLEFRHQLERIETKVDHLLSRTP